MNASHGRQIVNKESFTPLNPNVGTLPGNPDILFPPNNEGRQAIVTSRPKVGHEESPQIDNWVEAPQEGGAVLSSENGEISFKEAPTTGASIFGSNNGQLQFSPVPPSGKYVVTIQNGQIQFVLAPPGDLKILNNDLGWTDTEDCEE